VKFEGREIELPWERWRGVRVTPETIKTPGGRTIDPGQLDLLLWKAAFYDRGHRASFDSILPGAVTAKGGSHG